MLRILPDFLLRMFEPPIWQVKIAKDDREESVLILRNSLNNL